VVVPGELMTNAFRHARVVRVEVAVPDIPART
jgi:hypothetical protein